MSEQEDGIKEDAMQESSWIRKAMDRSGSFCHDNVQRERERGMREVCRQRKKESAIFIKDGKNARDMQV
jgi:hypothetical protein